MMESPLKRRRVSLTRSLDISPVKVAPVADDNGGSSTSSSTSNGQQHSYGTRRTASRRSAANLSPNLANLAAAAAAASTTTATTTTTTAARSSAPPNGSARTVAPDSSRRAMSMDGANDEDVFDPEKIGREAGAARKNMTPRSLASIALRNARSSKGTRLSASPAPSAREASADTANGKPVRSEGTNGSTIAGEDQENLRLSEGPSGETPATANGPGEGSAVNHLKDANDEMEETIEPELPTLPAQLGLEEMPTPPQGLLSSSPSGKKQKRLARQRSTIEASSLKQKTGETEFTNMQQAEVPVEETQMVEDEDGEEGDEKSSEEVVPLQPSGPIVTWDLEIERKQNEYELLRREKTRLEAETRLLEGSLSNLLDSDLERLGGRPDEGHLLHLLLSEQDSRGKSEKPKTSSTNDQLAAFLPFAVQQTITEPTSSASNPPPQAQTSDIRPYLQFFAPFQITLQSLEIVPEILSDENGILRQRQRFKLTSPDNQLELELLLLTHPLTHDIAALDTKSISPWADFELGARFCRNFGTGGAWKGDIATLGRGVSRYWELASLRARVWEQAASEHGELVADMPSLNNDNYDDALDTITVASHRPSPSPLPTRGKGRGRGRGGKGRPRGNNKRDSSLTAAQDLTDEISSNDSGGAGTLAVQRPDPSRSLRHRLLGRRQMLLKRDRVALLFSWDIELDWTGEAHSQLDACVACPQSWRDHGDDGDKDGETALDQVGELFHLLVRRQGVRAAIRAIVGTVFGKE